MSDAKRKYAGYIITTRAGGDARYEFLPSNARRANNLPCKPMHATANDVVGYISAKELRYLIEEETIEQLLVSVRLHSLQFNT